MMRKWMLLLFMLMTPLVAGATAVTGTVTDAGSQAWANGTWAIQVVPPPGSGPQPALNQNGTLNGSGVFTATITATSSLTPSGAKWQLTVCPQATAECYISFPVITGTTQSLTVTPPAILVNVQSGPVLLYQDNEFANPTIGQFYYNLTSSVYRSWNGSAWMSITPGGGGGTITSCSTAGGVAYENGTNNTLTCGSNFIYSSANKAVDINNGSTTTAQGTLSVRGTGSGIDSPVAATTGSSSETIVASVRGARRKKGDGEECALLAVCLLDAPALAGTATLLLCVRQFLDPSA
jgi:hypothetical protein